MKSASMFALALLGALAATEAQAAGKVRLTFSHVDASDMDTPPFDTGEMYVRARVAGGQWVQLNLSHCSADPPGGGFCVWPEFLGLNQQLDVPVSGNGTTVDIELELKDSDSFPAGPDDTADLVDGPAENAIIRVNLNNNTWDGVNDSFPYRAFQPQPGPPGFGCSSAGSRPRLCWNAEFVCDPGDTITCSTALRECDSSPGTQTCDAGGSFGACVADALNNMDVCKKPACRSGGRNFDTNGNMNKDDDGDGLFDCWEDQGGIDYDANGSIDLPLPGADSQRKNLYVEVDWFDCAVAGGDCAAMDTHSHRPLDAAVTQAQQTFANAATVTNPNGSTGITLSIQRDESLAHRVSCLFDNTCYGALKMSNFGTAAERMNNPARLAKRVVYRYSLWSHNQNGANDSTSGVANVPSQDSIISLGSWTASVGSQLEQAGTFVHEFGHNLGLNHGGGDGVNFKPNYLSVMNYRFQTVGRTPGNIIDYSVSALPNLTETGNMLIEANGIQDGPFNTFWFCPNFTTGTGLGNGALNWDCLPPPNMANNMVSGDLNGDRTCVNAGGDQLQTPAANDDLVRLGQIDPGMNGTLNTMIAGDDVVLGNSIFPGPDAIIQSIPAMDDVLNGQVIWDGPDRTCDSAAMAGDGQVRPVGNIQTPTLNGFDDWRSNIVYDFSNQLNGFQINGTPLAGKELDRKVAEEMKTQATLADLSVTQTFTRGSGSAVTITIVAKNNGTDPAVLATVNDKVPTEINPLTCTSSGGEPCIRMGNHFAVNLQSLAVGQQKTITITACSTAPVSATNTASITSASTDPNLANNAATKTLGANSAWTTGKVYAAGDRVTFQGMVFKCVQGHTSQSTWTPTATPSLWNRPAPCVLSPWQTQTDYPLNHQVTFNGHRYKAQQAHVSQAAWTPTAAPSLWLLVQ